MEPLLPVQSGQPSAVAPQRRDWDLLLTAETHNFPCAVAPYPGAGNARAAIPYTFSNPWAVPDMHATVFATHGPALSCFT